jgi:hypothetical protein
MDVAAGIFHWGDAVGVRHTELVDAWRLRLTTSTQPEDEITAPLVQVEADSGVVTVVRLGLVLVNVFVARGFPWAIIPTLGMSIGVWFHWDFGVRHGDALIRRHRRTSSERPSGTPLD